MDNLNQLLKLTEEEKNQLVEIIPKYSYSLEKSIDQVIQTFEVNVFQNLDGFSEESSFEISGTLQVKNFNFFLNFFSDSFFFFFLDSKRSS